MNELQLLGPRAYGDALGTAVLKAIAEDFQVDEVLDIPFSGDGEHLWIWVEKRGLNTEEAARRIAKAAGVPLRTVSYAGLKDRQALTRQWFSVQLPGKADPDLSVAENDTLKILKTTRHKRKLQRGAHSANGFTLRLTQFAGDKAAIEERLQQIVKQGVPNYFGTQRFGFEGGNVVDARSWAARKALPEQRNVRSRLLSTARSFLFNQVLAARVADGTWQRALVGDLLAFTDSRSFFPAGEAECSDPRLAILDLHPTGPQWGEGDSPATGVVHDLEQEIAAREADLRDWLINAGMSHERRIQPMRILISNDDGVTAPGLAALYAALADYTECVVIAPEQDKSGASSSLTLDRPLHPQYLANGFISLNGTPTDCVHLGLNGLLEREPDMVVSGINLGANLGDDVLYSGTVAAALEGRFLERPSFAFSLVSRQVDNLSTAAHFARKLVEAHAGLDLPPRTVLNVNIPNLPIDHIRGIQLTRLGHRARAAAPMKVVDPRGKAGYWIAAAGDAEDGGPGTDFHAVMQGYVSITPLQLDRTFNDAFRSLDGWLEGLR
jgi:tRNA pseudouridine13 synthase